MKNLWRTGAAVLLIQWLPGMSGAQPAGLGSEEFGMNQKELVQAAEKVETLISQCMRAQGFSYIAADYNTVRKGMKADKNLPGMSEEAFIKQYGFGVSTMYTGQPPQLATGYSPGKLGLGERNIDIYKKLSPADQAAYNRTLFGENTGATFAIAMETENFSQTGGCTRASVEQVFKPEHLKATYTNQRDILISKDPRMKAALRRYAAQMHQAGFNYNHPDEVETDIRARLAALTNGGTVLVARMAPEQRNALKDLQDYERRAAAKSAQLQQDIFDPVEEKILAEMYARKVK